MKIISGLFKQAGIHARAQAETQSPGISWRKWPGQGGEHLREVLGAKKGRFLRNGLGMLPHP